jgi:hypothetical protein
VDADSVSIDVEGNSESLPVKIDGSSSRNVELIVVESETNHADCIDMNVSVELKAIDNNSPNGIRESKDDGYDKSDNSATLICDKMNSDDCGTSRENQCEFELEDENEDLEPKLLSDIPRNQWLGLVVKNLMEGMFGRVVDISSGWVAVRTTDGVINCRPYDLEIVAKESNDYENYEEDELWLLCKTADDNDEGRGTDHGSDRTTPHDDSVDQSEGKDTQKNKKKKSDGLDDSEFLDELFYGSDTSEEVLNFDFFADDDVNLPKFTKNYEATEEKIMSSGSTHHHLHSKVKPSRTQYIDTIPASALQRIKRKAKYVQAMVAAKATAVITKSTTATLNDSSSDAKASGNRGFRRIQHIHSNRSQDSQRIYHEPPNLPDSSNLRDSIDPADLRPTERRSSSSSIVPRPSQDPQKRSSSSSSLPLNISSDPQQKSSSSSSSHRWDNDDDPEKYWTVDPRLEDPEYEGRDGGKDSAEYGDHSRSRQSHSNRWKDPERDDKRRWRDSDNRSNLRGRDPEKRAADLKWDDDPEYKATIPRRRISTNSAADHRWEDSEHKTNDPRWRATDQRWKDQDNNKSTDQRWREAVSGASVRRWDHPDPMLTTDSEYRTADPRWKGPSNRAADSRWSYPTHRAADPKWKNHDDTVADTTWKDSVDRAINPTSKDNFDRIDNPRLKDPTNRAADPRWKDHDASAVDLRWKDERVVDPRWKDHDARVVDLRRKDERVVNPRWKDHDARVVDPRRKDRDDRATDTRWDDHDPTLDGRAKSKTETKWNGLVNQDPPRQKDLEYISSVDDHTSYASRQIRSSSWRDEFDRCGGREIGRRSSSSNSSRCFKGDQPDAAVAVAGWRDDNYTIRNDKSSDIDRTKSIDSKKKTRDSSGSIAQFSPIQSDSDDHSPDAVKSQATTIAINSTNISCYDEVYQIENHLDQSFIAIHTDNELFMEPLSKVDDKGVVQEESIIDAGNVYDDIDALFNSIKQDSILKKGILSAVDNHAMSPIATTTTITDGCGDVPQQMNSMNAVSGLMEQRYECYDGELRSSPAITSLSFTPTTNIMMTTAAVCYSPPLQAIIHSEYSTAQEGLVNCASHYSNYSPIQLNSNNNNNNNNIVTSAIALTASIEQPSLNVSPPLYEGDLSYLPLNGPQIDMFSLSVLPEKLMLEARRREIESQEEINKIDKEQSNNGVTEETVVISIPPPPPPPLVAVKRLTSNHSHSHHHHLSMSMKADANKELEEGEVEESEADFDKGEQHPVAISVPLPPKPPARNLSPIHDQLHDSLYSDIQFNSDSNQQDSNSTLQDQSSVIIHSSHHDTTWSSVGNADLTTATDPCFKNSADTSYLRHYNLTSLEGDLNNIYASKLINCYHDLCQDNGNGVDSWRIHTEQWMTGPPLPYVSPSIPSVLPPKYVRRTYPLLNHRNNREVAQEHINQVFPVCMKNVNVLIAEQNFYYPLGFERLNSLYSLMESTQGHQIMINNSNIDNSIVIDNSINSSSCTLGRNDGGEYMVTSYGAAYNNNMSDMRFNSTMIMGDQIYRCSDNQQTNDPSLSYSLNFNTTLDQLEGNNHRASYDGNDCIVPSNSDHRHHDHHQISITLNYAPQQYPTIDLSAAQQQQQQQQQQQSNSHQHGDGSSNSYFDESIRNCWNNDNLRNQSSSIVPNHIEYGFNANSSLWNAALVESTSSEAQIWSHQQDQVRYRHLLAPGDNNSYSYSTTRGSAASFASSLADGPNTNTASMQLIINNIARGEEVVTEQIAQSRTTHQLSPTNTASNQVSHPYVVNYDLVSQSNVTNANVRTTASTFSALPRNITTLIDTTQLNAIMHDAVPTNHAPHLQPNSLTQARPSQMDLPTAINHQSSQATINHQSSQPTINHQSSQHTINHQSSQHTINHQSSQPTINHQSSQPTINHQSSQHTINHQSSQPTINHQSSQPTINHQSSQPTINHQPSQPTVINNDNILPSNTIHTTISTSEREATSTIPVAPSQPSTEQIPSPTSTAPPISCPTATNQALTPSSALIVKALPPKHYPVTQPPMPPTSSTTHPINPLNASTTGSHKKRNLSQFDQRQQISKRRSHSQTGGFQAAAVTTTTPLPPPPPPPVPPQSFRGSSAGTVVMTPVTNNYQSFTAESSYPSYELPRAPYPPPDYSHLNTMRPAQFVHDHHSIVMSQQQPINMNMRMSLLPSLQYTQDAHLQHLPFTLAPAPIMMTSSTDPSSMYQQFNPTDPYRAPYPPVTYHDPNLVHYQPFQ